MMKRGFLYALIVIMLFSAGLTSAVTVFADTQETLEISDQVLTYIDGGEFTLETTGGSGNGAVTFVLTGTSAAVELLEDNITFRMLGAGDFTVKAIKAAEDIYDEAESAPKTFTVEKGTQSALAVTEVAPKLVGETFTLEATGGLGMGAVTFIRVTGEDTVATLSASGEVTTVGVGAITVKAVKAEDSNYLEAQSSAITILVEKPSQDITFTGFEEKVFGVAPFKISASGGVAGEFTYTYKSGSGYMTLDNTIVATGAGNIVINIFKAGNAEFSDVNLDKTIVIKKAEQSGFKISDCKDNKDGTYSLITSGGSGKGALSFAIVSGNAQISEYGLVSNPTGEVKAVATKGGDTNYNQAVSAEFTVNFNKSTQTGFGIVPVNAKKLGDEDFELNVYGGNGEGAVTYELLSGAATLSPEGLVTITGAGNIVIKAKKLGDDNFFDTEDTIVISVLRKEQAEITLQNIGEIKANTPVALIAAGGSGTGIMFFEIVSGNAVIDADGKLIAATAGQVVVRAVRAGDKDHEYAMSAEIKIKVLESGTAGGKKKTGCDNAKNAAYVLAVLPFLFVTMKKKI